MPARSNQPGGMSGDRGFRGNLACPLKKLPWEDACRCVDQRLDPFSRLVRAKAPTVLLLCHDSPSNDLALCAVVARALPMLDQPAQLLSGQQGREVSASASPETH